MLPQAWVTEATSTASTHCLHTHTLSSTSAAAVPAVCTTACFASLSFCRSSPYILLPQHTAQKLLKLRAAAKHSQKDRDSNRNSNSLIQAQQCRAVYDHTSMIPIQAPHNATGSCCTFHQCGQCTTATRSLSAASPVLSSSTTHSQSHHHTSCTTSTGYNSRTGSCTAVTQHKLQPCARRGKTSHNLSTARAPGTREQPSSAASHHTTHPRTDGYHTSTHRADTRRNPI